MRSHMRGNTLWPPAPSTNDAFQSLKTCGEFFSNDNAAGAAVSGSVPKIFTSGLIALMALATPVINPPPPMLAMIAFVSGASSKISRPIVPWPAMKLSSSNGCTNVPSAPGNARSSSAFQATSYGTGINFAPRARMRSTFDSGAVSMTTTVHGTPACRAA